MSKTTEALLEILRNPKRIFRKTDAHAAKRHRNRYERRKLKEYLHRSDWQDAPLATH
jgi:hypothetical protein